MSRIGKKPILISEGITVELSNNTLTVKGPKGSLTKDIHPDVSIKIEEGQINIIKKSDNKFHRALFGTIRSVVNNMVVGVSEGFSKELLIEGMGYKAEMKGEDLNLIVGYSHPILFRKDETISFSVEGNTRIIVKGIDKERVGEIAAEIRAVRPPEPYKGKGIRYKGERIRRKAGKIAI